jgi:hypothetical protein
MWEGLFADRKWRVAEEISGAASDPAHPELLIVFTRGLFEMKEPAAYRSPLSTNLGRRGAVLQETSPDGTSDVPGSRLVVGNHALRKARSQFSAVW